MLVKMLNHEEKLLFGRNLQECASRVKTMEVKAECLPIMGISDEVFRAKMSNINGREFSVMECDVLIAAFLKAYGEEAFVTRFIENFQAIPFLPHTIRDAERPLADVELDHDYQDPRIIGAGNSYVMHRSEFPS